MASKAKTEARFGLSGPSYLLGPVFKAAIGHFEPFKAPRKASVLLKKKKGILPRKTAGSAAVKRKLRAIIQKSKRSSWKEFVAETKGAKSGSDLIKILTKQNNEAKLGMIGKGCLSSNEALETMIKEHFPGSVPCDLGDSSSSSEELGGYWQNAKDLHYLTIERLRRESRHQLCLGVEAMVTGSREFKAAGVPPSANIA